MPPRTPVSPPPHYHAQGVGIPWLNGNCMSNSQGLPPNSRLCQLWVRLKHKGQQLAGRVWLFGLECLSVSLWGPLGLEKRRPLYLAPDLGNLYQKSFSETMKINFVTCIEKLHLCGTPKRTGYREVPCIASKWYDKIMSRDYITSMAEMFQEYMLIQ